jgi:hypothetical protein
MRYFEIFEAADQAAIDAMYAARYWQSHPGYEQSTWANVENSIKKYGRVSVFVNKTGMIDEVSKEKLAAFRVLARQHGYQIGQFARDPRTPEIVSADVMNT